MAYSAASWGYEPSLDVPRVSVATYLGLGNGPSTVVSTEEANSFPVDGSNAKLRLTSPFSFRVVPPPTLLAALAGEGEAKRSNVFDSALARQRAEIEAGIAAGTATQQQLDALVGTRAPATPSFAVIDAALSTTNNFQKIQNLQRMARQSLSGSSTTPMIGQNGKRFTDLHPANGDDMAMSDLAQGRSMISQVRQMLATPPLTLLINPQSLTINYTKKQAYQDRNRNGYIFQAWGEELPRLSVSGKTGAFYAGARNIDIDTRGFTSSPSGVQWINRRDSASGQNLECLLQIYRNNGIVYDLLGRTEAHLWVGLIEISFDQFLYLGHFESFNYGFSEELQGGGLEFSFEFGVSEMFDLAQRGPVLPQASPTPSPSDPRWLTPLRPSMSSGGPVTRTPDPPEGASTAILDPFVR